MSLARTDKNVESSSQLTEMQTSLKDQYKFLGICCPYLEIL